MNACKIRFGYLHVPPNVPPGTGACVHAFRRRLPCPRRAECSIEAKRRAQWSIIVHRWRPAREARRHLDSRAQHLARQRRPSQTPVLQSCQHRFGHPRRGAAPGDDAAQEFRAVHAQGSDYDHTRGPAGCVCQVPVFTPIAAGFGGPFRCTFVLQPDGRQPEHCSVCFLHTPLPLNGTGSYVVACDRLVTTQSRPSNTGDERREAVVQVRAPKASTASEHVTHALRRCAPRAGRLRRHVTAQPPLQRCSRSPVSAPSS